MTIKFDLTKVEQRLKAQLSTARVGFAADFNSARSQSVQSASVYVLPIAQQHKEVSCVNSEQEYQLTETFAVMIVLPCFASNQSTVAQLQVVRDEVDAALEGVAFLPFTPIAPDQSRLVELNQQTNNLIFQSQFSVSGLKTVTTNVVH